MKRIVFYPDKPVDRPGDLFRHLVEELGLDNFEIDGDPKGADFVAFIGKERAEERFGRRLKAGPVDELWQGAAVYVLPSTAPEMRRRYYEGIWRSFAAHVLGRDLAVRDEYKGMAPEEIKRALDEKRNAFAVLVANLVYDINLGSIIRTANAFLAEEILIYGRKKMDLRGAMGAYVYENIVHLPDLHALEVHVGERGYTVVCMEETESAQPLSEFEWPERPLMVFGQEGPGVPEELRTRADKTVFIPQHGSIRSLNVGVAAGIAMYDWHSKRLSAPGGADS
ncbi:MAG: TrmH family RNA methyltransferase [Planctomycetota bacterium]|jgi:tRNA(Leu) C34 or U34 (ribose-2'-O)-methylase TrmL